MDMRGKNGFGKDNQTDGKQGLPGSDGGCRMGLKSASNAYFGGIMAVWQYWDSTGLVCRFSSASLSISSWTGMG